MPRDTTPDPRDMERMPERQRIPEGRSSDVEPDMRSRPALPEQPATMAADVREDDARAEGEPDHDLPADGTLNRG